MRKSIAVIALLSISLLVSTYLVGEMVRKETQNMFATSSGNGLSSKLIRYEKQLFSATAVSEFTVEAENTMPIIVQLTSNIRHYPHMAKIESQIQLLDPILQQNLEQYFSDSAWLTSSEEISLLGNLSGELELVAGSYIKGQDAIATEAMRIEYDVNLKNYSGSAVMNWAGGSAFVGDRGYKIDSLQLSSDFSLLTKDIKQYSYVMTIASILMQQSALKSEWQGLHLKGRSTANRPANRVNINSDWKIAHYQFTGENQKIFTDNHINLDLNDLYMPSIDALTHEVGSVEQLEQAFTELLSNGAQISLSKLSSQTPWGEVLATMNVTLDQGASFSEMLDNPFTLMDYIDGQGKITLPQSLLKEPMVSEPLQIGMMTGFLILDGRNLLFETQFDQGVLVVNGKIIPL